jgi:hypothetical protein
VPETSANAGQQLARTEGLRHIVVGALLQRAHPRFLRVTGRQDDDGSAVAAGPELLNEVEASGVHNDHRGAQRSEAFKGRRLIVCSCVAKPRAAQHVRNQFDQVAISIRDENLRVALAREHPLFPRAPLNQPRPVATHQAHPAKCPPATRSRHELLSCAGTRTTLQCNAPRPYGSPPVTKRFPLILAGAGLFLLSSAVAPYAAAQSQVCPLVGEADISNAVGSPVQISPFLVVDSGSSIQCLFEGDSVGDGVLVGRYPGFFGSEDLAPFSADSVRLHFLLPDGMPAGSPLTLTAVDGIGDAAAWVVPADVSAAPDSLGRLLVRRGSDAFVFGTENGPGAVDTATLVGKAVLAAST